jgi:hypothetical protein
MRIAISSGAGGKKIATIIRRFLKVKNLMNGGSVRFGSGFRIDPREDRVSILLEYSDGYSFARATIYCCCFRPPVTPGR